MARELVVLVANKIQKLSTKVLQSHMKYVGVACRNKSCMGEVGQILSNSNNFFVSICFFVLHVHLLKKLPE